MTGNVSIKISTKGLDKMIKDFGQLESEGTRRAQEALDQVLDRTAETSYGLAHLDEGQLRASQSHSSVHGPSHWEGQITYTSRAAGYEMAKGGDHSAFIDALAALSGSDFEAAIDTTFDGM